MLEYCLDTRLKSLIPSNFSNALEAELLCGMNRNLKVAREEKARKCQQSTTEPNSEENDETISDSENVSLAKEGLIETNSQTFSSQNRRTHLFCMWWGLAAFRVKLLKILNSDNHEILQEC